MLSAYACICTYVASTPSNLVLVQNLGLETDPRCKTKPYYFSPMVVLRRTYNGTYYLAELDSTVLKLCYTAFCIVPYFTCSQTSIPVMHSMDCKDLATVAQDTVHNNANAQIDEHDAEEA
jgi:hypothetical protein